MTFDSKTLNYLNIWFVYAIYFYQGHNKLFCFVLQIFHPSSILNPFTASIMSGFLVVLCMTPFDVVSTRLYNQQTTNSGRGAVYNGVTDCFAKIFRKEGLWGFYKGWGASLFRLGPHTVLSLVIWNELRRFYLEHKSDQLKS